MTVAVADPLLASLLPAIPLLLLVVIAQTWHSAHRRTALNRALHEVRRPLQALALTTLNRVAAESGPLASGPGIESRRPPGDLSPPRPEIASGTVWQAITAVSDLDRELNGGGHRCPRQELVACRLLVDACVRRWQPRARLSGAELRLRWAGPDALIRGDGMALAAAVENLLLNAIEHGGPRITVNALTQGQRLRLEIIDSGRANLAATRAGHRAGHRRHGHGLKVAERVAGNHGGQLDLHFDPAG